MASLEKNMGKGTANTVTRNYDKLLDLWQFTFMLCPVLLLFVDHLCLLLKPLPTEEIINLLTKPALRNILRPLVSKTVPHLPFLSVFDNIGHGIVWALKYTSLSLSLSHLFSSNICAHTLSPSRTFVNPPLMWQLVIPHANFETPSSSRGGGGGGMTARHF